MFTFAITRCHCYLVLLSVLIAQVNCLSRQPLSYAKTPDSVYVPPKNNVTTLLDIIKSRDDLSELAKSLEGPAGFVTAFDTPATWNYTFFAPSNTAFNNTGAYYSTFKATPKGKWWLGNLLTHHYVPNSILRKEDFNETLSRLQTATFLYVSAQQHDGIVTLNKVAKVTESDILVGANGIVHIIDHVLDPSAQIFAPELPKSPTTDPANVVQALVYTLLDVFDAARDLHLTLKTKEKRDYEHSLRSKGYPESRRIEYIDENGLSTNDDGIVLDKAAVTRKFEDGFHEIGAHFAVGDVVSQTGLQSQIITLQSVLISTFLYGPTGSDSISHQISSLLDASRAAGMTAVDILAAQHQRQLASRALSARPTPVPTSRHGQLPPPAPYPVTTVPSGSTSSALVRTRQEPAIPTNPTIAELKSRPRATRTDTESTSFSEPISGGAETSPSTSYCDYARDLQRHSNQALSSSITSTSSPYCPCCRRDLHLAPGKSWEVYKDDEGPERCFRVQNRFIVKCHRDTADGGYSCVLCSRGSNMDTICGDVKALVRHVWMDHDVTELQSEPDIVEVVQRVDDRRRDSGAAFSDSKWGGSRRSVSLGPNRRPERRSGLDRETGSLRRRSPRWD
ncbi:hypothetical protein BU24DRAFT_488335 [Aaosphaeria arxii CBS 175.79]|uniref:FAS1 domain-containing protein n=1 Tax=Aaosphaeria arxii CBS 175.79 TaxID=1450172 RepID=A0A6A5Y8V5_9PLEO|nr:uncharacterized protein BU24DRAFT_488335 [Aaosphaeria arxii CBS 175.79]KAF2022032.1 hypothetical protein BU24DRAFT_488335 [Aaosphaeria arxii CBS 175.79]